LGELLHFLLGEWERVALVIEKLTGHPGCVLPITAVLHESLEWKISANRVQCIKLQHGRQCGKAGSGIFGKGGYHRLGFGMAFPELTFKLCYAIALIFVYAFSVPPPGAVNER
jgi:hypothetical protein